MNTIILNKEWGRIAEEHDTLMPYARVRGTGQVIKLAGFELYDGEAYYDEKIHKGNLACPCCDAAVHVRKETPVVAGGNMSPIKEHIATNPGAFHDVECAVRKGRRYSFNTAPDKTRPLLMYLDMPLAHDKRDGHYSLAKRKDTGIYTSKGAVKTSDDFMKSWERVSLHSANDVVNLFNRVSSDRIWDGVVIHHGYEWMPRIFFPNYENNGESFRTLASHLSDTRKLQIPVSMPIVSAEGLEEDSKRLVSTPVYFNRRAGGHKAAEVHPAAYIDTYDKEVMEMVREPGVFRILGYAGLRPKPARNSDGTVYHVAVSIKERWQIERVGP